jgi:hypothetical protein
MPTNSLNPWSQYAVGQLSQRPNWINPDCQPLEAVAHTAHVDTALNIIKDGRIEPRLIYDESILNNERILVVWLSPNIWHRGSRYGNVVFEFNWDSLCKDKHVYWVESILKYRPPACRILLTTKEYKYRDDLRVYDPRVGDGPWWYNEANNTHYWNGRITLEVMVEDVLHLSACSRTTFVRHNPNFCTRGTKQKRSCTDYGMGEQEAQLLLAAGLVGNEIDARASGLVDVDNQGEYKSSMNLRAALDRLMLEVERKWDIGYTGKIPPKSPASKCICRAILAAVARRNREEAQELASLFPSAEKLLADCVNLVADSLAIPRKNMKLM